MQQMLLKNYDRLQNYFEKMTGIFLKALYRAVDCGNHHIDMNMNMKRQWICPMKHSLWHSRKNKQNLY